MQKAFSSFENWLNETGWTGTEHEFISNFFTRAMLPEINKTAAIKYPHQVFLEAPVPQVAASKRQTVWKDLVIRKDGDPNSMNDLPVALLEWKIRGDLPPRGLWWALLKGQGEYYPTRMENHCGTRRPLALGCSPNQATS